MFSQAQDRIYAGGREGGGEGGPGEKDVPYRDSLPGYFRLQFRFIASRLYASTSPRSATLTQIFDQTNS